MVEPLSLPSETSSTMDLSHVLLAIDSAIAVLTSIASSSGHVPAAATGCVGLACSDSMSLPAARTVPVVAIPGHQDDFLASIKARLAEVMSIACGRLEAFAARLVAVGPEVAPDALGEVVEDVEAAFVQLRLELFSLLNECLDTRLRRVELLHNMQVGSLNLEKPVFEG